MKLVEKDGLRILTPESSDFVLYSVRNNSYCEKVFLGINDSVDNYREISRVLLRGKEESEKVKQLEEVIKQQNAAINDLAKKLAELQNQVNKK